jgi:hypothetical protein
MNYARFAALAVAALFFYGAYRAEGVERFQPLASGLVFGALVVLSLLNKGRRQTTIWFAVTAYACMCALLGFSGHTEFLGLHADLAQDPEKFWALFVLIVAAGIGGLVGGMIEGRKADKARPLPDRPPEPSPRWRLNEFIDKRALAGKMPSPEEIAAAAEAFGDREYLQDWKEEQVQIAAGFEEMKAEIDRRLAAGEGADSILPDMKEKGLRIAEQVSARRT